MPEFERPVPEVTEPSGPVPEPRRGPAGRLWTRAAGLRRRVLTATVGRMSARARTALAVSLALLAVVSVVVVTRTAAEHLSAGPRDPANVTRFDMSPPPGNLVDLPGKVVSVDLAADGFGAALAQRCARDACRHSLAVSTDGRRWQRRRLPDEIARLDTYQRVIVTVLRGRRILVSSVNAKPWFSTDQGRSWRAVAKRPGEPVAAAGRGRLVLLPPKVSHGCLGGAVVGVASQRTGRLAPLKRQPELDVCWLSPVPDPWGWQWAGGVDPASRRPAIAATRDGGATWRVERLPTRRSAIGTLVTWSQDQRYAVALGGTYDPYVLLQGLYRGRPGQWDRVAKWSLRELLTVRGTVVVQPAGGLLLVSTAGVVLGSPDDGETFRPTGHPIRLGSVRRTRDGLLARVQNSDGDWLHSRDGVAWRRLAVR